MAITKEGARQYPLYATKTFAYTDVTDDAYVPLIDIPPNAIVVGGFLAITTLFNSGTDDKFSIGDQEGEASADKTEYSSLSADVTTAGTSIAVVPNGKKYAQAGTVGVVWNGSGTAPSAGIGTLVIAYIIDGRAHEVQPV